MLKVDNVRRDFGGITAVNVDHLEVQRGIITAQIGPNGAGKTTFFNLITGFDKPPRAATPSGASTAARWGAPTPRRVAKAGMVRTFQLTKSLRPHDGDGQHAPGRAPAAGREARAVAAAAAVEQARGEIRGKAEELLARFKLLEKKDDYAGSLSGGPAPSCWRWPGADERPRMIMLDEPMAGVNPALTQSLLGHIQTLRDEGTTVLFGSTTCTWCATSRTGSW